MSSDAKHSIFLSKKKGGIGIRSFTREYMGALLKDIEVFISNQNILTAHALLSSIEAASNQHVWKLNEEGWIPQGTDAAIRANHLTISGKRTLFFYDTTTENSSECVSYDHVQTMEKAIRSSCQLGFILRDLNNEVFARFADELLLMDRSAKAIASPHITTRANLGPCLGDSDTHFSNTLYWVMFIYYFNS
jgi:hypothetical protein